MIADPLLVLLVEDSPTDAKLVERALRSADANIQIQRVETADALRAAIMARPWDIVLSDWSLPGFNALAALKIVRDSGLDLPFIIVSGTIGEEAAVDAIRAGADDYVQKDRLTRLPFALEREVRDRRLRAARVGAERALAAEQARFRALIEHSHDGISLTAADGTNLFLSPGAYRVLGLEPGDPRGADIFTLLHPDDRARVEQAMGSVLATPGTTVRTPFRVVAPDGSTRWIDSVGTNMTHVPDVGGIVGNIRDVTQEMRASEALRSSERRFRCLWDAGVILIAIADAEGRIREMNAGGLQMLGRLGTEDLTWDGVTPPEWRAVDAAARARATIGGSQPWEKELVRADGSRVPVLVGEATLEGGETIVIAVDLSEQKRSERALHERVRVASLTAEVSTALTHAEPLAESLARCAAAIAEHLDAAAVFIWTSSADGSALELQASGGGVSAPVAQRVARVPINRETHVGRIALELTPWATNVLGQDAPAVGRAWVAQEGLVAFAGHPLLVDGRLLGVVGTFARQPLCEVVVTGLGAIADALTLGVERKLGEQARTSLEAQLRQAQKMEAVGRLAGGIAHDFNNLLSVVLTYSELVQADMPPGDPLREDVEEIRKAGLRAAELTRQLLMFSRQQVLAPRVVDLNELLAGMDRMLQRILGEDVDLVTVAAPSIGGVRVDPTSIEQVVMNLVVNARDAMPTGGKLTIETDEVMLDPSYAASHIGAKPGPHVLLAVTDSGAGMDVATQQKIFDPFFTTKPIGKGTGLGLATVLGIVQQSGGHVAVYSEVGIGTTFKVYLPRVSSHAASLLPAPAPPLRGTGTVLVVEDDDQVRAVVTSILRRQGYSVLEARGAAEAMALAASHAGNIDLLLTDVVMPHTSGPELAKRLVAARPSLKVICMSGYTDDSIVRHGVLEGDMPFLQKPVTPETLSRKVREVLDR